MINLKIENYMRYKFISKLDSFVYFSLVQDFTGMLASQISALAILIWIMYDKWKQDELKCEVSEKD